MTQQIELMVSMQATNPTNAIGTAKELIESCCKTILDEMGIPWSKTDDVPQLTNKTLDALNLFRCWGSEELRGSVSGSGSEWKVAGPGIDGTG